MDELPEDVPTFPDWVKPGASFVYVTGRRGDRDRKTRRRKYHVRALVDTHYVVLREWWPSKQRWNYVVENIWFFHFGADMIADIKKAPRQTTNS